MLRIDSSVELKLRLPTKMFFTYLQSSSQFESGLIRGMETADRRKLSNAILTITRLLAAAKMSKLLNRSKMDGPKSWGGPMACPVPEPLLALGLRQRPESDIAFVGWAHGLPCSRAALSARASATTRE